MLRREPSTINLGLNDLREYFSYHKNRNGAVSKKSSDSVTNVTPKNAVPVIMHNQRKVLASKNRTSEVQRRIGYDPSPISPEATAQFNQDSKVLGGFAAAARVFKLKMTSLAKMEKYEQFMAMNTLSIFLMGMLSQTVQVEMKNESVASGVLRHVDGFGNITLEDARITNVRGQSSKALCCILKASSIRYVHLPKDTQPGKVIKSQVRYFNRCFAKMNENRKKTKLFSYSYGDEE